MAAARPHKPKVNQKSRLDGAVLPPSAFKVTVCTVASPLSFVTPARCGMCYNKAICPVGKSNRERDVFMKTYPFNALVSRMKYIRRWSLMHAARPETLSEHTTETAVLAHTLCMIAQEVTGTPVRPETVAVAALYHDAQEILTGDMPTPVKYKNERLRNAYKALETESALTMLSMLPPALRQPMTGYVTGRILSPAEERLLKAADRLSALIKCMEEVQAGNREFAAAMEQQRQALSDMHCPEVDYFLERMLPCYSQTLDELTRPEQQEEW